MVDIIVPWSAIDGGPSIQRVPMITMVSEEIEVLRGCTRVLKVDPA